MDDHIDALMRPVADAVSAFIFFSVPIAGTDVPLIVIWLVLGGLFFTGYLGFINFRGFVHSIRLISGRYARADDPGEITQFQALTTAVAGTVGIGNIAGVAVAISMGGPGATFWLIVAGLLGMSTKFAECTLGMRYRAIDNAGVVAGGPMYYLQHGLAEQQWPKLGRGLGIFYAASMVVGCLGIGNMFQSNQAAAIFVDVSGGLFAEQTWVIGLLLAVVVGVVTLGGIRSIATTTAKLVPAMALLYAIFALVILALNADQVPAAFRAIVDGAFDTESVAGGIIGVMIIGFRRAVFSNEAGLGSASIAHATAKTPFPAAEGHVALLEPFIDTVVICTMTALVIITTVYTPELMNGDVSGIELTTRAFASTLSWSPVPLSIAAILFAFSTMIAWSYYGLKAFEYLSGGRAWASTLFKLVFLAFVVLGASVNLSALIDLSDALVFVVAIPNLLGLYLLAPVVKEEMQRYENALKSTLTTQHEDPKQDHL